VIDNVRSIVLIVVFEFSHFNRLACYVRLLLAWSGSHKMVVSVERLRTDNAGWGLT
jgi:hypothetical protein